jgi:hypothetical protein
MKTPRRTATRASGGLASPAALHWFKKKDVPAADGMVSNTQGKAIEKPYGFV